MLRDPILSEEMDYARRTIKNEGDTSGQKAVLSNLRRNRRTGEPEDITHAYLKALPLPFFSQ